MKRGLLRSPGFVRASKRLFKRDPSLVEVVRAVVELLVDDPFHPQLRTHKLKGPLEGSWACSAGYDLRIVFSFVQDNGREAILLEMLGSHDDLY